MQKNDLVEQITLYLSNGGLFNPELANHVAVRDLLIQCKEALEQTEQEHFALKHRIAELEGAVIGLQAQLAQPEQEPVAWCESDGAGGIDWRSEDCFSDDPAWLDNPVPLYTTPPQRKPLSDEEIILIVS